MLVHKKFLYKRKKGKKKERKIEKLTGRMKTLFRFRRNEMFVWIESVPFVRRATKDEVYLTTGSETRMYHRFIYIYICFVRYY